MEVMAMSEKRRQVNFRLSDEEEARVLKMAERAGLSFSSYCKKMAVEGKVKPQVIDKEMGKAMLPHFVCLSFIYRFLLEIASNNWK